MEKCTHVSLMFVIMLSIHLLSGRLSSLYVVVALVDVAPIAVGSSVFASRCSRVC